MKNKLFLCVLSSLLLAGCVTTNIPFVSKSMAYKSWYNEQPLTVLLMPPINKSTEVEAKEYFHSTLNVPFANAGFYVIPSFLSMEILKRESAYDAEVFFDTSLEKFGEVFGADLAVFTIIHKWDKSEFVGKVHVQVEYVVKSTKTNEVLYSSMGDVLVNTAMSLGVGGLLGALADVAATAINTAATKYIDVARVCNAYAFKGLPSGKYSPLYGIDGDQPAESEKFSVQVNSAYN